MTTDTRERGKPLAATPTPDLWRGYACILEDRRRIAREGDDLQPDLDEYLDVWRFEVMDSLDPELWERVSEWTQEYEIARIIENAYRKELLRRQTGNPTDRTQRKAPGGDRG